MAHNSLPVPLAPGFPREWASSQNVPGPWIYLQLLSLDTPLIAVSWQFLLARAFHLQVSTLTLVVLALCVWMIYAADHLLDVRKGSCYSKRHEFAWHHRNVFRVLVAAALLISSVLVFQLPHRVLVAGVALAAAMMIYFGAVHAPMGLRRFIPKEAAVAVLFAAGSSIVIWSSGSLSLHTWTTLFAFTMLCLINCCMVDVRESQENSRRPSSPHSVTRWLGRRMATCYAILLLTAVIITLPDDLHLRLAMLGSAAALFTISFLRRRLSADAFRFACDMALLVPALLALL